MKLMKPRLRLSGKKVTFVCNLKFQGILTSHNAPDVLGLADSWTLGFFGTAKRAMLIIGNVGYELLPVSYSMVP